jgi:organic radical activating enzyme
LNVRGITSQIGHLWPINQTYRIRQALQRVLKPDAIYIRSLEINAAAHCNLKCYGCGRGSPALPEEFLSVAELKRSLKQLQGVLKATEIKIAGGEPLLHPELLDIIDAIRDSKLAERITLITNGVLLHKFDSELWDKIDAIWVSNYPGVKTSLTLDEAMTLGARHQVYVAYNKMDTFTWRQLNQPNNDTKLVKKLFSGCYQRVGCHSLYGGKFYQCAAGPFIPKWQERLGGHTVDFSDDGIDIFKEIDLKKSIRAYLSRTEPLAACTYCLAGAGKTIDNHQLNKRGVEDWLQEDHSAVHELIDKKRLNDSRPIGQRDNYAEYGHRNEFSD